MDILGVDILGELTFWELTFWEEPVTSSFTWPPGIGSGHMRLLLQVLVHVHTHSAGA